MKPPIAANLPQEIELKLALPTTDPSSLEKRLQSAPLLARRKLVRRQLHNVYYDTPDQALRQMRVALRIRRIGSDLNAQWRQTLKMGGRSDSALSQRGEWEVAVPGNDLSREMLEGTPWPHIDPEGAIFGALKPIFVTTFERVSWEVRRPGGVVIEVALDIGQVVAGDKTTPICELELELVAGLPAALFDVAQQIARTLAVLPAAMSKAERGYALAHDTLHLPVRAQPVVLAADLPLDDAPARVLREMFSQFTANLIALRSSDDPELVHQARVGWRRFKSACRLFKPVLVPDVMPAWQPLRPLLIFLGELRDLDVARADTLVSLAEDYVAADDGRAKKWHAMEQSFDQAAKLQRKSVHYALESPQVGVTLLELTGWVESLSAGSVQGAGKKSRSLRNWARRRLQRLHDRFERLQKEIDSPEAEHRVRILAKRLRYATEVLRLQLPKRHARHWHEQAVGLQLSLGASRDLNKAGELLGKLDVAPDLVAFLRGFAVGQGRR